MDPQTDISIHPSSHHPLVTTRWQYKSVVSQQTNCFLMAVINVLYPNKKWGEKLNVIQKTFNLVLMPPASLTYLVAAFKMAPSI